MVSWTRHHLDMSYLESLSLNILKACQENDNNELGILLHQLTESSKSLESLNHLIGPVSKLLPIQNTQVKKTAYSILPRICAVHQDAALLVANRVVQDTKDPNPIIKCYAITALTLIPQLHQDYAWETLNGGLKDGNPQVRLSTVIACENVFKHNPDLIKEQGLVDRLYECIRDSDPKVVVTCLLVLDTILAIEGGIVVNRSIAWYLLRRLADFENPQLASVLQVLGKYNPTHEEELFQELSLLDPYLVHTTSAAVIVNCIKLFLKLTLDKYPQLKFEILQRSIPILKTYLMKKSSKESINYILDFLLGLDDSNNEWLQAFSNIPNLFYPNENADISSITVKQMQILPKICNDCNFQEILNALDKLFCRNDCFSKHAINCISLISKKVPASRSACIKVLLCLLDCAKTEVSNDVFMALQDFNFGDFSTIDKDVIFHKVLSKVDFSDKTRIQCVLLLLLRDFDYNINKSSYMLEMLVADFEQYNAQLKCLILTCILKLFLHSPARYQHTLGETLKKCIIIDSNSEQEQLLVKEKALKYYHLLKHDANLVKHIV